TGSEASLGRAIVDWWCSKSSHDCCLLKILFDKGKPERDSEATCPSPADGKPKFAIISGKATGLKTWNEVDPANARLLNDLAGEIQVTQSTTSQLLHASYLYIKQRGNSRIPFEERYYSTKPKEPSQKVAFLIESNTGFGSSASKTVSDSKTAPQRQT